ncbi:MAG: phospho-N-acetylmuramoyl-pentapeptide-transferase [Firmicutes bacterium]|nr:phospho-N-acetylmuramoyl-pentapeptide-transferase [Bacillota bacterium]MDH7496413.1 phospho-N-acetylmuramoyl-pentapeptide-transferase [Bacillota bacterium]
MSREIYAALVALGTVLAIGPTSIRILRRMRFGQSVRSNGPATHLAKAGTPTMGGIMILLGVAVATLLFAPRTLGSAWALFITLGFGAIGLADDFIIVVAKRSLGLRARYKLAAQIVLAVLLGLFVASRPELGTTVSVPFLVEEIDLGLGYVAFAAFIVVSASNAVNLTDGLDGLASGTVAVAAVTYGVAAMDRGSADVAVFAFALAGACVGFAWFNCHPAQVIMGDTGSLALGAALGCLAILTKTELLLAVVGGVFVVETLSVMIQVTYFRLTGGRRLFRMSPLHHHFELMGWQEPKVVTRFWILGLVFAVLGMLCLRGLE